MFLLCAQPSRHLGVLVVVRVELSDRDGAEALDFAAPRGGAATALMPSGHGRLRELQCIVLGIAPRRCVTTAPSHVARASAAQASGLERAESRCERLYPGRGVLRRISAGAVRFHRVARSLGW